MGYALLYESMLDSVLVARDRFLRPGGVMVPSQCKMMFGLTDAKEIYKERIGFWNDIYGDDGWSIVVFLTSCHSCRV
jgi:type I protein arginine methyltransferase